MGKGVSITSEFVAIIKSEKEPYYIEFVTRKAKCVYNTVRFLFSDNLIERIFKARLDLSDEFEKRVAIKDFDTLVDFGCGDSLRGFFGAIDNPTKTFIDSDFDFLLNRKKDVLEKICLMKNIDYPTNYHLVQIDIVKDNIYDKLKNKMSGEKVLATLEGVSSYFNNYSYNIFLRNVKEFLEKSKEYEFFSHEGIRKKRSLGYKIIRGMVSMISFSKSHIRFTNEKQLKVYFKNVGLGNVEVYKKNDQFYYSVKT